jgi:excisionase family DNA binding protein
MRIESPANLNPLLVDRHEAARLLGVSPKTIFTMTKEGQLPSVPVRRAVRYSVADLTAWIAARRTVSRRAAQPCPSSN